MTHPAVIIGRKTISLRDKFKKLEKTARKNGHARRVKFYNFTQTRLKRFGNWFFTLWSEETQELMRNDPFRVEHEQEAFARFQSKDAVLRWIKTPEWVNELHQLQTGTQTTIGDMHGNQA